MSVLLDILGWAALVGGAFFCFVGALGLNRMPDVFARMHAASVSDTLGVGLLTLGMLSQTTDWTVAVRLLVILIVLWVTGAGGSHALARAALHAGIDPVLADEKGELRPTPCATVDNGLAERIATTVAEEKRQYGADQDGEAQPSNS